MAVAQPFFDELLGCGLGEAEAGVPDGGRPAAEAVVEEELEVGVVGSPLAVVEGLAVVGVGAGVEQQPGQLERVPVGWGVAAALAVAESTGEGGKGVFGFPQVAGVAVGAGVEQEACDLKRGVAGARAVHARVGQVQEGFPPVRATLGTSLGGIGG